MFKILRKRRKIKGIHQPDSRGFSLIEVMFAMTFLGIGLLAVAQMIPLGMAGVVQARVRTNATQAAQEKLDELRGEEFNSAPLTAGTYTEDTGDYALAWEITDNIPVPGVKRVALVASWENWSGIKTVNLTTHLTPGQ
jgi:prepilin-type N-terminal cleavage/methylation domain-containing protein